MQVWPFTSATRGPQPTTDTRGAVPVVGSILLVALTVIGALAVGAIVTTDTTQPQPTSSFDATVDHETNAIALRLRHGDELDVSALSLTVTIDGTALRYQPPLPFFAADGFESGPTGPFNTASSDTWRVGERGEFQIASTNDPALEAGTVVEIQIYYDGQSLTTIEMTA